MGIAQRYGLGSVTDVKSREPVKVTPRDGNVTKPSGNVTNSVTKRDFSVVTQVTRAEFDALVARVAALETPIAEARGEEPKPTGKRARAAYMRSYRAKQGKPT